MTAQRTARLRAAVYAVFAFGFPVLVGIWFVCRLNSNLLVYTYVCRHVLRFGFGAAIVLSLIGSVLFILDAYRSQRVPAEKRLLWCALILFGGLSVMPFYWWWYVRLPGPPPQMGLAPGPD